MNGFNGRVEKIEKKISELEDRITESSLSEQQRENRWENEQELPGP